MSTDRRRTRGLRLPLWAFFLVLGLTIFAFLALSSVWVYRTAQGMASGWEVTNPDFSGVVEPNTNGVPQILNGITTDETTTSDPAPILSSDALKPWDGQERISILMLGIDQRCEETGPTHTDTLMIVTIDPVGMQLGVLSLPRDLWVDIPGIGLDRINQANYYGEIYELPGGGPALAVETVESTLGVPIDYYAAVNFDAFIQVVDMIGGITLDVPEAIDDPKYPDRCYGFDPFSIQAGTQQLDGVLALKYARTRATFGGDVDRAERQQEVVLAIRDQVLQVDMVPQLVRRAPQLWQAFQQNVRTNMTIDEAVQLALLMQEIPRENIQTAVIDYNYVYNETTADGRQVLVPVRDEIRVLRDSFFAPPAVPTPAFDELPPLMREENARVAIYNGTAVFGLAGATQTYLEEDAVNIAEVGNADSAAYRTTQVIDYGEHPNTVLYLIQKMDIPPLNVTSGTNPEGDYDILIILGDDWRVPEEE